MVTKSHPSVPAAPRAASRDVVTARVTEGARECAGGAQVPGEAARVDPDDHGNVLAEKERLEGLVSIASWRDSSLSSRTTIPSHHGRAASSSSGVTP